MQRARELDAGGLVLVGNRSGAAREAQRHADQRVQFVGEDVEVANLTRQREFFSRHLQPWALPMCESISAHPKARFYKSLARFTHTFTNVESQGFDMLA